jgi:hypothetical protein
MWLDGLGDIAMNQGDLISAKTYKSEALAISRERGDDPTAMQVVFNLGLVEYLDDDPPRARSFFLEALTIARRLRAPDWIGQALFGVALTKSSVGEEYDAALLHAVADIATEQLGQSWEPTEAELRGADHLRLRAGMGEEEFLRAYQHGRRMPLDQAIALAEELHRPKSAQYGGGSCWSI